ncbi:MAG: SDR family NAD(P)-dependent oxidoreductase [Gammaproteobacteria bacterium]|nr:SDR family NAD(P)-dependent oxidoreductase [Gammaproteobacteria bacterium]MDD9799701.1 SDR family NAD(P)-dependent oxidoreductase [Gammaproteobacteria bacterium]MDD9814511.1 SDR family NAD(P)-dependent oxidoreductase [Gammaproteobacteria bacterium]MDD9851829.1 SDR family NAD(P)-dependent oxidoreductase [Gammaproteobacteria bacterium]MDD9870161.1 SDR family NAD(P)-dependent oxidoreductase [Gammaproteobacteria bacterium]
MNAQPPRAVLISGCSSGIGYALARDLGGRGFRVLATARRPQDVEKLSGEGLTCQRLDLDDSGSIAACAQWALEQSAGNFYALINNGAYGQPGAVEDLSRDALREQFETNVFGTQELTNLLLPELRRKGGGRIVQISSVLGFVCLPWRGAYNASKYALEALTDTMRMELRGSGVFVSLVEPGPISTRFGINSLRAFDKHLRPRDSVHRDVYESLRANMKNMQRRRFSLPPESVVAPVAHALSAATPRIRYRVTVPTHVFAALKRILPAGALDRMLSSSGGAPVR